MCITKGMEVERIMEKFFFSFLSEVEGGMTFRIV